MACCVFAAFLISQIFAVWEAALGLIGLRRTRAPQPMWRLDMATAGAVAPAPAPARPRFRMSPLLMGAVAIELVVLLAAGNWLLVQDGAASVSREFGRLAQVRSVSDLRDLCGI